MSNSSPVTVTNISSSTSSSGTVTGSTGGNATSTNYVFDYGIVLTDSTNSSLFAKLGGVDSSWSDSTGRDRIVDVVRYAPFGRQRPISSYRRTRYWQTQNMTFFIPYED